LDCGLRPIGAYAYAPVGMRNKGIKNIAIRRQMLCGKKQLTKKIFPFIPHMWKYQNYIPDISRYDP
jgi:hypothetical protein